MQGLIYDPVAHAPLMSGLTGNGKGQGLVENAPPKMIRQRDPLGLWSLSYAAGKSMKLLLELAAKGDLFAEGGREAKKNPESDFGPATWATDCPRLRPLLLD
jgi:hypothetical protein